MLSAVMINSGPKLANAKSSKQAFSMANYLGSLTLNELNTAASSASLALAGALLVTEESQALSIGATVFDAAVAAGALANGNPLPAYKSIGVNLAKSAVYAAGVYRLYGVDEEMDAYYIARAMIDEAVSSGFLYFTDTDAEILDSAENWGVALAQEKARDCSLWSNIFTSCSYADYDKDLLVFYFHAYRDLILSKAQLYAEIGNYHLDVDGDGINNEIDLRPNIFDAPPETPVAVISSSASSVSLGSRVTVNAQGSYQNGGVISRYEWILGAPSGSNASLSNTTSVSANFTPDINGRYLITLRVGDGKSWSRPSTTVVLAENQSQTIFDDEALYVVDMSIPANSCGKIFHVSASYTLPVGVYWDRPRLWVTTYDPDASSPTPQYIMLGLNSRPSEDPNDNCSRHDITSSKAFDYDFLLDMDDSSGLTNAGRNTYSEDWSRVIPPGSKIYIAVGAADNYPFEVEQITVETNILYDKDGDGISDSNDHFPLLASEQYDSDGDGVGDNADAFDNDMAASVDSDGDYCPEAWNSGYGQQDSSTGLLLDQFPNNGNLCIDADGDGYDDITVDRFPDNSQEWADSDGDGVGDNSDAFPQDVAASIDADEDQYPDVWNAGYSAGDSSSGLTLDLFPADNSEHSDSDGDGFADGKDWAPQDSTEWADSDDDGYGDNEDPAPQDPNRYTNVAPEITAPLKLELAAGTAYEFVANQSSSTSGGAQNTTGYISAHKTAIGSNISILDADGDAISIVANGPSFVRTDIGGVSITPLVGDEGVYDLYLTARDGYGGVTTKIIEMSVVAASNPVDSDGDGVVDGSDNCPNISNPQQINTDLAGDGGDACDTDDDNDGVEDSLDEFPLDPTRWNSETGPIISVGANGTVDISNVGLGVCELIQLHVLTVPSETVWKSLTFGLSRGKDAVLLAKKDSAPTKDAPPGFDCENGYAQAFDSDLEVDLSEQGEFPRWSQDLIPGDSLYVAIFSYDGITDYSLAIEIDAEPLVIEPTISGDTSGAVTEDNETAVAASGTLVANDFDGAQIWFTVTGDGVSTSATGAYGTFTIGLDSGQWTYTLDNADPDTNALNTGDSVTDAFAVSAASQDGTGEVVQNVTIEIHGATDSFGLKAQQVRLEVQSIGNGQYLGTVLYKTSDDSKTHGLGLRLHYSTSQISDVTVTERLQTNLLAGAVQADSSDFDQSPLTDTFVNNAWASISGSTWPPSSGESVLMRFTFSLVDNESQNDVVFNFTSSSTATGYYLSPQNQIFTLPAPNSPPHGQDNLIFSAGELGYNFSVNDFGFSDDDNPSDTFVAVKITTLPERGELMLEGSQVHAGDLVSTENLSSLHYSPPSNFDGEHITQFTFQVQDDGGSTDIDLSPNTMQIDIGFEWSALNDLYSSTVGEGWTDSTGWMGAPGTQCDWFGVLCFEGHVYAINFENNNLIGTIPDSISKLSHLRQIQLADNSISGSIPSTIGQLSRLERFSAVGNEISGAIPESFWNLTDLQIVELRNNQLVGTLPNSIGNLTKLRFFSIFGNELMGPIPAEIGDLNELEVLYLNGNDFSGYIPPEIGALSKLKVFDLSNNQLSGVIPESFANLTSLEIFNVSNNNFSGFIPQNLFALNIDDFRYSGNRFGSERAALIALYNSTGGVHWVNNSGWLGEEGSECAWFGVVCSSGLLTGISMPNNGMVGTIPDAIGDLWELKHLVTYNNHIDGVIPETINSSVLMDLRYNPLDHDSPVQIVSSSHEVLNAGTNNTIRFNYSVANGPDKLTGLGLRIHFNSSEFESFEFANILASGLLAADIEPQIDSEDFDNNPGTNRYISIAWTDISGNWPTTTPIELFRIETILNLAVVQDDLVRIGFSTTSTANGYGMRAPAMLLRVVQGNLDVDGDSEIQALTDGLMIVRRLFGFSGDTLIDRAISSNAAYTSASQIQERLQSMEHILDIDGNGRIDALTDGLMVIRYMFGFRGSVLVNNAIASDATRTSALEIETYISQFMN